MKNSSLIACLLSAIVVTGLLTGCAGPPVTSLVPGLPAAADANDVEPADTSNELAPTETEELPPPVIVTSSDESVAEPNYAPVLQVQVNPDGTGDDLPEDVVRLIESISQGRYVPGDTGGTAIVGEPTFVRHDLNGDGVEDEIIILVADGSKLPELDAFIAESGAAAIAPQTFGEGVAIRALLIEPGAAGTTISIVDPDDPLCCPAGSNPTIFKLEDGRLRPLGGGE